MAEAANLSFDDQQWRDFLKRNKRTDWSPILKAVYATIGHKDIVQHFDDEAGPKGRWKRRSAETQSRYSKIFSGQWKTPTGFSRSEFNPSNKVLQKTGLLRGSILPTNVTKVTAHSVRVFSPVKYSGAHDRGSKTLPQREFMWLTDGAKDTMMRAIMQMAIQD
jgi:phage gpG-like protein